MIKGVFLVGSLRKNSYNKLLAEHIIEHFSDKIEFEMLDIDLPLYNEDLDLEGKRPEKVELFNKKISDADVVFMATPEYNHALSGVLKNAIDWASRTQPGLEEKPGLIMSASLGATAGARAYNSLLQILDTMGMRLLPGNDIMVGAVHEKFDETGKLHDASTISFIELVMDKFMTYYDQVK